MLREGLNCITETTVVSTNTAASMGSGDMEVFATPAMVALMEEAAAKAVRPFLPEGSSTVGSKVEVGHTKPSGIGSRIVAKAELTAVEGRKLTFRVTASDEEGTIGEGIHERYIVDRKKFLSKLDK